ncbi:Phytochrome-like protein cph2 [Pelotomaculum schinkii]|uniref:histidine kinase n=1 Tax=Pelotomaculum schinkii TaxID=78350 RepID=A0A4Y7RDY0_9FIRM|nr:diguanylate cyclase [Pelotomaculum schinkii]TEB06989.1 Phytochrome-like protein cph2 [Pelotomaculum schinkii]
MSDSFFQNLIDNIPLLVKVLNHNGTGAFFNKGWLEFTGRTLEQEIGSGWSDGLHPEDIKGYLKAVEEACGNRQSNRYEYRLRRADGVYRWILEEGKPVTSPGGGFESYICSGLDITEQKQAQEKISNNYFDEFTGLPNRRFFEDYLRREWGRAARTVRSLTLVMCSAGHNSQKDNKYLKLLGSAINKELNRPGDFLALYSDEKFMAILPETDAQGAAVVVDRIRTRVKTLEPGHSVPDIGLISAVPTIDVSTAAELVELAEQAMQQEKKQKK